MGLGRELVARQFDELSERMGEVIEWSHKLRDMAERTQQAEVVSDEIRHLEQAAIAAHFACVALREKWRDAPAFRSN